MIKLKTAKAKFTVFLFIPQLSHMKNILKTLKFEYIFKIQYYT